MYKVVYTKTLDDADEIVAQVFEHEKLQDAINSFNENVKHIVKLAFDNEYFNCKMSMHKHKALIKIENTHYCLAIVEK